MSTTLYVKSNKAGNKVLPLVKSAIDAEITKLELALEMASKRISLFEEAIGRFLKPEKSGRKPIKNKKKVWCPPIYDLISDISN